MKLKLFNLTGLAGSYLILAPLRENPPLNQQYKKTPAKSRSLNYYYYILVCVVVEVSLDVDEWSTLVSGTGSKVT